MGRYQNGIGLFLSTMNKEYDEMELRTLASQLKRIYKVRKEEKENRPYKPNKRFDDAATWLKTAKVVKQLNADPADYIEAQFRFGKSLILANTLHGPVAQKRYRQYKVVCMRKDTGNVDLKENPAPRHADLAGMIADFWHDLDYHCGSHDLTREDVRATVLDMHLRYDPLVAMLLSPTPDFKKVFGEAAKEQLIETPHLRTAAQEMNLGLALDYLYEQ